MTMFYLGYGANSDQDMINAITGRVLSGQKAHITGFELCVQKLENVPEIPRKILKRAWGDSFESYVIKEGLGRVYGTLWEMTTIDRDHISKWELIPEGWYTPVNVEAILEDGSKVRSATEMIVDQTVNRVVDGKNYKTYLMDKRKMIASARVCRVM